MKDIYKIFKTLSQNITVKDLQEEEEKNKQKI